MITLSMITYFPRKAVSLGFSGHWSKVPHHWLHLAGAPKIAPTDRFSLPRFLALSFRRGGSNSSLQYFPRRGEAQGICRHYSGRADHSRRWLHNRDAPVPFELFQYTFIGTRVLPFAFGFSPGQAPHLAERGQARRRLTSDLPHHLTQHHLPSALPDPSLF